MHVATAASGYASGGGDWASWFSSLETHGSFQMTNVDGDGKPDLVYIKQRDTGAGYIEVHVATAAGGYGASGGDWSSWFGLADGANGLFQTGADSAAAGLALSVDPPSISGPATVGSLLACSAGTWLNAPSSLAFGWLRDGAPIPGATTPQRVLALEDAGHTIACRVTATNAISSASRTSAAMVVPAPPMTPPPPLPGGGVTPTATFAPIVVAAPPITGSPFTGSTLVCGRGAWENAPTSFVYAWLRDGVAIVGVAGDSYGTTAVDAGHLLACRVTASNTAGHGSATSAEIAISRANAVVAVPSVRRRPHIAGSPRPGGMLRCVRGSWSNAARFSFSWLRAGKTIANARASTYRVKRGDLRLRISCRVVASGVGGSTRATTGSVLITRTALRRD